MKLVAVNYFRDKNNKIEDNIFCFSMEYENLSNIFILNIIKENFNKLIEDLSEDDIINLSNIILKLNPSKILYSIIGLLFEYSLTIDNEKILKNNKIEKILNIISKNEDYKLIMSLVDNKYSKKIIEEYEKKHNILIVLENIKSN